MHRAPRINLSLEMLPVKAFVLHRTNKGLVDALGSGLLPEPHPTLDLRTIRSKDRP